MQQVLLVHSRDEGISGAVEWDVATEEDMDMQLHTPTGHHTVWCQMKRQSSQRKSKRERMSSKHSRNAFPF